MVSATRLPLSTLNTYHNSNGLLYQFILSEFLITFGEVKKISRLITSINSIPEHLLTKKEYELFLKSLGESISVLAGASQEYMRLFTWNLGEGAVAKLKNYCAFLSERDNKEDDRLISMYRSANRTWLLSLHSMDLLRSLLHLAQSPALSTRKKREIVEEINIKESLCHSLEKMSHHMRKLARLIAEVTFDYRRDENIIFFILRHTKCFNELFGKSFVMNILIKMFPKGLKDAENFIVKRYTIRGFQDLLPVIQKKFEELQQS